MAVSFLESMDPSTHRNDQREGRHISIPSSSHGAPSTCVKRGGCQWRGTTTTKWSLRLSRLMISHKSPQRYVAPLRAQHVLRLGPTARLVPIYPWQGTVSLQGQRRKVKAADSPCSFISFRGSLNMVMCLCSGCIRDLSRDCTATCIHDQHGSH